MWSYTEEMFERVRGMMPTDEEAVIIKAADWDKLLGIEKRLYPFCMVPKLQPRMRVLGFVVCDPWRNVSERLKSIRGVWKTLRESSNVKMFLRLLLALGNYINLSLKVESNTKWFEENGKFLYGCFCISTRNKSKMLILVVPHTLLIYSFLIISF